MGASLRENNLSKRQLNVSTHDLKLVADFQRGARNRVRGHFQHAARGQVRPSHAKRAHIFNQLDDPQLAIKEDHVNCEEHPESVDAVRGAQPESFGGGETAAAKHQTAQPLEKCVGERDLFGKTLPGRAVINFHFASGG